MSMSSLPEWKQLLLERKKREDERRERREKEEEERLSSMPTWKREIIQRRKAKQEGWGEREREGSLVSSEGVPDSSLLGSESHGTELTASPWLDGDSKPPHCQVSTETITPVHKNPFIRSESARRRGRETEKAGDMGHERGNEQDTDLAREKGREKSVSKGPDGEVGKGRDVETKIERYRDRSEGRERDKSARRDAGWDTTRERDRERERERLKGRRWEDGEERDLDSPSSLSSLPLVSGLRTIRAGNIIIIEQERRDSGEWRGRRRATEEEEEMGAEQQEKRGVAMELRELLAGGGSVTEIRASEVLIIQPSVSSKERCGGGGGEGEGSGRDRETDGEMRSTRDGWKDGERERLGREVRWASEKQRESTREKECLWAHPTTPREDRRCNPADSAFAERGGRVSELLSKFGERPKPPTRSKSSENFARPGKDGTPGDRERRGEWKNAVFRGVPKRSFSFSDRVVCAKENGTAENGCQERMAAEEEGPHSDGRMAPSGEEGDGEHSERASGQRPKRGCWTQLTDNGEQPGKPGQGDPVRDREPDGQTQRERNAAEERERGAEPTRGERMESSVRMESGARESDEGTPGGTSRKEEGFTVASAVRNTEGFSFARRVAIRQDGWAQAMEREESERAPEEEERAMDREPPVGGAQTEPQIGESRGPDLRRGDGWEDGGSSLGESPRQPGISPARAVGSHCRHTAAFTECSSLPSAMAHRPGEPSGGAVGLHSTRSSFSQRTEDLSGNTEIAGETMNARDSKCERGAKAYGAASEGGQEKAPDARVHSDTCSEKMPPSPPEVHIPRTVFYGVEETPGRKRPGVRSDDGRDGSGVERRDSWRVGKPLSRVESLREKIRQREKERLRNTEGGEGDGNREGEGAESTRTQRGVSDRCEERRGSGAEREREAAVQHISKGAEIEKDKGQEVPTVHTATALDVRQEVDVSQAAPWLPVPPSFSQDPEPESHSTESDEEEERLRREELRSGEEVRKRRPQDGRGEDGKEELSEEEAEEEEECPSVSPSDSLSTSPPFPCPLAAMSRIYNVKTVDSRTAVCVSERTVDLPSHIKVQPHAVDPQEPGALEPGPEMRRLWGGDSAGERTLPGDDTSGLQTVRR